MKKTFALLFTALLLLGALAGCTANPAAETTPAQTAGDPAGETETPAEGSPAEAFSVDGSVLFEKDGLKITTAGLDQDPTTMDVQPIIWVDIENSSDKEAWLGVANGSVNGWMTDALLIEFYQENGEYYGGNYAFSLPIPAESSNRYALGYYMTEVPGVNMDTLEELEFCFTLAPDEYTWPDYYSDPVKIVTGEPVETIDISAFGEVVIDNETMTLVFGNQDYDDWFGPETYLYVRNKSHQHLGLTVDSAEIDGISCDEAFYTIDVAPGKTNGSVMRFDGEIRKMKGFESLTVNFLFCQAETRDELNFYNGPALDPITVNYPPQIWGEYENGGLRLEIQPKYNELLSVETPAEDENGVLFTVSETASLEAGRYDGAGWLFSIGMISEEQLHEMLCSDMSGVNVFARDEVGNYYVCYHPTDVRYERATQEEMESGIAQWTMLNEWADNIPSQFAEKNGLEDSAYGNSEVEIYLARAAWRDEENVTLSTTEFGPVDAKLADGTPYAEFVMHSYFWESDLSETPDGEYVVLNFPDEDVRLDFFLAPYGFVRVVSGESERLYQAVWVDDNISIAEVMQGWYYAAAEKAGVKKADTSLDAFFGIWSEKIAGRAMVTIKDTLAPGKVEIEASWPESAGVMDTWRLFAVLDAEGRLVYENGERSVTEFDENGEGWTIDESYDESGWFYLNENGELCWHDEKSESEEDGVFVI